MKIYLFDISYLIFFVLLSFFISIYLFGSSILGDFKDLKYISMKILGSFYIGSLDISDKTINSAKNVGQKGGYFDK